MVFTSQSIRLFLCMYFLSLLLRIGFEGGFFFLPLFVRVHAFTKVGHNILVFFFQFSSMSDSYSTTEQFFKDHHLTESGNVYNWEDTTFVLEYFLQCRINKQLVY